MQDLPRQHFPVKLRSPKTFLRLAHASVPEMVAASTKRAKQALVNIEIVEMVVKFEMIKHMPLMRPLLHRHLCFARLVELSASPVLGLCKWSSTGVTGSEQSGSRQQHSALAYLLYILDPYLPSATSLRDTYVQYIRNAQLRRAQTPLTNYRGWARSQATNFAVLLLQRSHTCTAVLHTLY